MVGHPVTLSSDRWQSQVRPIHIVSMVVRIVVIDRCHSSWLLLHLLLVVYLVVGVEVLHRLGLGD